jgi:hypothetical protein
VGSRFVKHHQGVSKGRSGVRQGGGKGLSGIRQGGGKGLSGIRQGGGKGLSGIRQGGSAESSIIDIGQRPKHTNHTSYSEHRARPVARDFPYILWGKKARPILCGFAAGVARSAQRAKVGFVRLRRRVEGGEKPRRLQLFRKMARA